MSQPHPLDALPFPPYPVDAFGLPTHPYGCQCGCTYLNPAAVAPTMFAPVPILALPRRRFVSRIRRARVLA